MLRVARATAVLGASVIAVVASCFSKPGEPHLGGGDGDGGVGDGRTDGPPGSGIDAGPDAPVMQACTNTDDFTSGTGCGAIGAAYGPNGIVGRQTGLLTMAAMGSAGGCRSSAAFSFAKPVSIRVVKISESAMTNTTTLRVTNGANASEGMEVIFNDAGGSSVVFDSQCLGATPNTVEAPYDQSQAIYWKFEAQPNALGSSVHAAFSATGAANGWTDIGLACPWSSVATVKFDVSVGPTAASSSQLALFDDFNVKTCP